MKRLAVTGIVLIALLVGGAQAAGELTLTVVSQTSSTITLGWTPQPGYGYLFSADGNLVSRTNDANRNNVRFSKSFSTYEVAVIVKGATGTYPPPPPPGDTTPPSVTVTQPGDGSTVSGNVNVTATATDNVGVTKVEFLRDGAVFVTDTTSPYAATLDTSGVPNGSHALSARAYDAAGNTGTSSVTVTVANGPPPGGNVFLSPSGNDSAACTQTAPCRSMQRGATVATAGQVVSMAAGSYPQQTLANIQKQVTFKAAGSVVLAGQLEIRCTTNVTVDGVIADGISSKNLLIAAGNRNLLVSHTSHGGGTYTAGNEDDPVVVGNVGSCSGGTTSDGVVLDNMRVHDYFWQQNTGSAHTDCLQFFGGTANVTIRNSLFERCAESFIGAYPDFGNITNTVVEDTTFRDLWTNTGKGTFFAMQWGCPGHPYTVSGTTFRRTVWSPGVPVPIRTDCPNFLVENNTFQTGPQQFACDSYNEHWNNTVVWRNNTFLNGNACVAP